MGARRGDRYDLTPGEMEAFRRDGYARLRGVLAPEELAPLAADFDRFARREIPVPGRDFCDMSGDYERPLEDFAVLNIMLPRRYYPPWRGNLYERRAASIAAQLHGPDMGLDYDQLLAKRPGRADALFHWHQDQAYWPDTPDQRTATCWLALDDATVENGCLRFVAGSHLEPALRPHRPLHGERGQSHTLVAQVDEGRDRVVAAPIEAGDALVFGERLLHGSGGNASASSWRRAYVIAFRSLETIAEERSRGFTHSHNDARAVLDSVAAMERRPPA